MHPSGTEGMATPGRGPPTEDRPGTWDGPVVVPVRSRPAASVGDTVGDIAGDREPTSPAPPGGPLSATRTSATWRPVGDIPGDTVATRRRQSGRHRAPTA